ncbi:DUF3969 family protein [Xenorhabdus sp. XENO-10]|uniref:DUF3969 family protein n=1 Tax=Xenorhabdus yunnanensis TaxID=3025878 RepID=A0ABT5LKB0_9GAMM|nr:DUF3969 family protein [Xenorhabdus yunnanensis]MDC9591561.1 DUF3969 family protein [Xenorhabdus yunnanensis]
MKLSYHIEDKHAEKFISLLVLGVLHALDKKLISINEAEGFIFKPYVSDLLETIKSSQELSKIIIDGCLLDDVKDLIPDKLQGEIDALIERTSSVIRNSKEIGRLVEKEIRVVGKGIDEGGM